jgi:DNA-binding Lrp family transcriptional regulator
MVVVVYVLMVSELGKEYEVKASLEKIKGITEARTVYGEFDIVARLETPSLKELDDVVTQMRRINGIIRTVTLISA